MKKKAIISAIIIILILISVLPLPQKIEKTYYGYDTISGEPVDVSLNMKHLRFLLFKDKMSGEIRVTNGDEVTVYGQHLWYQGLWPLTNEDESCHFLTGWYIKSYDGKTLDSDMLNACISKDFNQMTIYHLPAGADRKTKQYICNVKDNKLDETMAYFGGYIR